MNTPMTISLTVDFLSDAGKLMSADGNDIFGVLIENKMAYSFSESDAAFTITVENYFQLQAIGDFIFNSK